MMKSYLRGPRSAVLAAGLLSSGASLIGCATSERPKTTPKGFLATREEAMVGGEGTIRLRAPLRNPAKPQITSVEILPGRGMNIYQVRGHLPGKGEVDLLVAAPLKPGENSLGDPSEDTNGNLSFRTGGALLLPYANRIRGRLSKDGATLVAKINGERVTLPANWSGKKPGAQRNAMHGLILAARISDVLISTTADSAIARATFNAGDFGGHWLSKTQLTFIVSLSDSDLDIAVTAKNAGPTDLPMGIGWHPYFALPSGQRSQAQLRIPARDRLLVDNYDDVFPTGKSETMDSTPYDFAVSGGRTLESLYLDDCFVRLQHEVNGAAVAEILDPAASYGMRVSALSPEISAFQVYAPPDKHFVALEPQFNWADPYNRSVWKQNEKTGMVLLKPGESTAYKVRLQLFAP